jgi:carboxylesterase
MTIEDRSFIHDGGPVGVLLVHGLGGTPIEMRFIAQGLAREGHTVYVPQLAGHCGTMEDLRRTCWQDWFGSVLDAHDRMLKRCDTVIVGGLSVGAVQALHLAAQRPSTVDGVVAMAPTIWLNGWGVPWHARLFNLVFHKFSADWFRFEERDPYGIKDPRVRALVTQAILSGDAGQAGALANPGSSMLEMRWLVNTVKRELPSIKQPTLVLHPREDDRAALSNANYLMRKLGGPVDVTVLHDSYHVVTLDRQRHEVFERTAEFTRRIAKAKTGAKAAVVPIDPRAARQA